MVKFTANNTETLLIIRIAKRFHDQGHRDHNLGKLMMDLEACHCNGNPLDLEGLLHAPDVDFFHDVNGIQYHIDRQTGELLSCFSPRSSFPAQMPRLTHAPV